jgi:DNA-binding CsgD family transcriptional regulator
VVADQRRPTDPPGLTRRETQVLTLVVDGMTAGQIARRLELSPRTVENHIARVKAKISQATCDGRLQNRAALVTYALEHGLVARPCLTPPTVLTPPLAPPLTPPLRAPLRVPYEPPPDDSPTVPNLRPVPPAAMEAPPEDAYADREIDDLTRAAPPVILPPWPRRPLVEPVDLDEVVEYPADDEDDDDEDDEVYTPRRWPTVVGGLAVLALLVAGLFWYRSADAPTPVVQAPPAPFTATVSAPPAPPITSAPPTRARPSAARTAPRTGTVTPSPSRRVIIRPTG